MLRELKADASLKDFGEYVKIIRRTQQGELLLEVDGKASAIVSKIRGVIEETQQKMRDGTRVPAVMISTNDAITVLKKGSVVIGCSKPLGLDSDGAQYGRNA